MFSDENISNRLLKMRIMKFLAIIRILKNPTTIICFSSFSRINVERLEEEESVKFFSVYCIHNIRLVQSIKVHEFSYDEPCCGFFNDHRERRKGEFN